MTASRAIAPMPGPAPGPPPDAAAGPLPGPAAAGPPPRAAIAACRSATERHARTFSLAAHLLPREPRAAAYAVYAFCRRADDAVDEAADPAAARAALAEASARLGRAYRGGEEPLDLELQGLSWAVRRFPIPRDALEQLLEGMALDLTPLRLRTWAELHRYCVLAAGTVGRALAPALGASADAGDAAEALGVAMQLTNILRDVREDLSRGRIYLADEELRRHRLSHADLLALTGAARAPGGGPDRGRLRAFLAEQVERARSWYARAEPGLRQIPSLRARLCVRAMGSLYGEILSELERRGLDPLAGRARVSTPRKLWLLLACLLGRPLPRPARPLRG